MIVDIILRLARNFFRLAPFPYICPCLFPHLLTKVLAVPLLPFWEENSMIVDLISSPCQK